MIVLNYYWTYFSSQELSLECACQLACLSKHSSSFQILIYVAVSLPLPYICTISIFNYPGYFGDWKEENWFITCSISYICHFCSMATWSVQPLISSCWIIAIDFILVMPLNLLPSFQNAHSYDLTKCHQFMLLCFFHLPS